MNNISTLQMDVIFITIRPIFSTGPQILLKPPQISRDANGS
jgi:hypothetical protein